MFETMIPSPNCRSLGCLDAFDWFLFRVLLTGPRKLMPGTRTSGIDAFRESHGAMSPAGPVVVVNYETHLPYTSFNQMRQS